MERFRYGWEICLKMKTWRNFRIYDYSSAYILNDLSNIICQITFENMWVRNWDYINPFKYIIEWKTLGKFQICRISLKMFNFVKITMLIDKDEKVYSKYFIPLNTLWYISTLFQSYFLFVFRKFTLTHMSNIFTFIA